MEEKKGFFKRLAEGLTKTRDNIVAGIDNIFSGFSSIDDDFYDEIEETLVMGDLGINATTAIIEKLKEGKDVACLTLGDPTIYSTYIYIHRLVKAQGYATQIINGIPSFCAVSAKLGDSLVDRSEQLHIIPSTYDIEDGLKLPGTKVLMKAASKMHLVKETLQRNELKGSMIENCGMPEEHIYHGVDEIPDQASYYSIIVVKEDHHD